MMKLEKLYRLHDNPDELLGKQWTPGETAIGTSGMYSYKYAKHILKGRFRKGEKTLAKDYNWGYEYAKTVIKGRFKEGEDTILDSGNASNYGRLMANMGIKW